MTKDEAWQLLKEYNKEEFHLEVYCMTLILKCTLNSTALKNRK